VKDYLLSSFVFNLSNNHGLILSGPETLSRNKTILWGTTFGFPKSHFNNINTLQVLKEPK